MTLHYSNRIAQRALKGIMPERLEGDLPLLALKPKRPIQPGRQHCASRRIRGAQVLRQKRTVQIQANDRHRFAAGRAPRFGCLCGSDQRARDSRTFSEGIEVHLPGWRADEGYTLARGFPVSRSPLRQFLQVDQEYMSCGSGVSSQFMGKTCTGEEDIGHILLPLQGKPFCLVHEVLQHPHAHRTGGPLALPQ